MFKILTYKQSLGCWQIAVF